MSDPAVLALPNGRFDQNCYLIADPASGEAVIVDPGEEAERFLAEAGRRDWRLGGIWLTHAHLDHVLGVAEVKEATGAPIWLHPADRPLYENLVEQGRWMGIPVRHPPRVDHALTEGAELTVGGFRFQVRHTPGHSPGSVTFVGHGLAFVGDVLFAGSIGRTDLPGGDYDTLIASIRREVYSLPDETRVLSGHGPETTVGMERRTNPFVRDEG